MSRPSRYSSITFQVPKLPPEVVHEIFGDLSILKLLEIVCSYDVPYIENCICSHKDLGQLFNPDDLAETKTYFTVYHRLSCMSLDRATPNPALLDLNVDAVKFIREHLRKPSVAVLSSVKAAAMSELGRYAPYLELLRVYALGDIPDPRFWTTDSADEFKTLSDIITTAETKMFSIKIAQLRKMASLVQNNPGNLRIRECSSQAPIRNEQHVIDKLLHSTKELEHRRLLSGRHACQAIFSSPQLYLVPYDRLLRCFLKVLVKYPPSTIQASPPNKSSNPTAKPHTYPAEMGVVLGGISEIYTRDITFKDEPGYCPRTLSTVYSHKRAQKARGFKQPRFNNLTDGTRPERQDLLGSLVPASEKELLWLEAFLQICQYMSSMQDEWKPGQTIGDYWRGHCL